MAKDAVALVTKVKYIPGHRQLDVAMYVHAPEDIQTFQPALKRANNSYNFSLPSTPRTYSGCDRRATKNTLT